MPRHRVLLLAMLVQPAAHAYGQSRTAPTRSEAPRFETASVKLCSPESGSDFVRGGRPGSPNRLVLTCQSLKSLVQRAWLMYRDGRPNPDAFFLVPISGGPPWIDSERYTIEAKSESPLPDGVMSGPMLRALLEDRFRLKVRNEQKEVPGYALAVVKAGSKLEASKDGACAAFHSSGPPAPPTRGQLPACGVIAFENGALVAHGLTMGGLCRRLSGAVGQPVVDRTGLAGAFEVRLALSQNDLAPRSPSSPALPDAEGPGDAATVINRALRKLGLRLEPIRTSSAALVIERAERPTAN